MWLRRTKSTTPFQHITYSPSFARSSLKDIESLFEEETHKNLNTNYSSNINPTPKSPVSNVFHRVLCAKSLLRAFPNDPKIEGNVPESQQKLNSLRPNVENNGVVIEESKRTAKSKQNEQLFEKPTALIDVFDENHDGVVLLEQGGLKKSEGITQKPTSDVLIDLPGTETRVVIFFTSLRVIRSTFEDCKYVRSILHSFLVAIDERDLFMDVRFIEELKRVMGKDEETRLTLPRVFIGGRYIGGAEEIRLLHEAGELKMYLRGMPPALAGTCEVCGGHGFILCLECNGSHRCYIDKGEFKACNACNENGLVRCASCSSIPL